MQSIIEPQTKPASEWIGGRVVQKVSPTERHARVQGRIIAALLAWTDRCGLGRAGTEWEFRLTPPGERARTLVPDVAYLSFARLPYEADEEAQIPQIAPDVAFEILSPGDRRANVDEKVRVYFACATRAVIEVDPQRRQVTIRESHGSKTIASGVLTHEALPGFEVDLRFIFARSAPRP